MNLRSKLFKKSWQSRDPETRSAAIRDDSDPELKAELPRLAQHDESAQVRLAALQRLNTEPFWLDARLRESDPDIIQAAEQFLSREVLRQERPELEDARLEWLGGVTDHELIRRIAGTAPSLALRRAALARISAQGFLGDCYVSERDEELAAELLVRIDQISTLERICQASRRSSKRRAQAAAQRLEQLAVAAGRAAPGQSASERLVHEAEQLARGSASTDRQQALDDLRERWIAVSDHPEALARRFDGAVRIIEAALQRQQQASLAADEPAEVASAPEPAEVEQANESLSASADFIRSSIRSQADIKPAELLAHWDRAWNQIDGISPADETLKQEMLPLLRELQAQVQMKKSSPAAPAGETAPAEREQPGAQFEPRLDAIAASLEAGDLSKADEQIRSLRSDYDRLPSRQRPKASGGRLQRMEGRLKEMRNWQHWSNNKIRDELIATVEALPDSGQHPDAVTAALKTAREEWKRLEALEILPGDKRRFAAPPGQWRRFQAGCKAAFDAAKPYFEKREAVQAENLSVLKAFIEAGTAAAANDEAEAKDLLGYLRKARQAIRRMDDLPPKARGSSAAGLRELMNRLSARLDARFEAVEATKRRLVAEARALTHEKDLKTALDKAKALQNQWQKSGSGRRKIEQQLWKEFREPIDPLFEQLKGETEQRREADQAAVAELEAICQQAEELAALPEEQLDGARGRLTGLIDQWLQQEGRPGRLNKRFEQAEQRFDQRLKEYRGKERTRARSQILALADSIQRIWEQRCAGSSDDLADLIQRGNESGPMTERLLALAERLASPDSEQAELEQVAAENLARARQIVVEMEFLSGLDSPAADQALRMDYQVQRLARRMSERERQPELASELDTLRRRWLESLPQPPSEHAELKRRFERARDIIENMVGAA